MKLALRRFYIEDLPANSSQISIQGELFHHISEVCRFKEGDRFELLPGDGKAWLAEVIAVGKKDLSVRLLSSRTLAALPKPWITLAISIPKLPKMDWIIEKCVELGVHEIRPFVSDFSFLRKTSELSENRLSRWQKLVRAATQQSGRGSIMTIQPAHTLENLLAEFNRQEATGGLFPYEGESPLGLHAALNQLRTQKLEHLWIFVGSEGGYSHREVELFARQGLNPVTLGDQILRVETACLALVSVIKYEYEQFEYGSIR